MKRKAYSCWANLDLPNEMWRIKRCSRCNAEIVWLKSAKTGKGYPVNFNGLVDVMKNDFHRCEK